MLLPSARNRAPHSLVGDENENKLVHKARVLTYVMPAQAGDASKDKDNQLVEIVLVVLLRNAF